MLTHHQLGKKLKEIRIGIGFSQEFVAKELDITRQAIISIESGKRKIDSFELFKLAGLYNISVTDLMTEQVIKISNFQEAFMHLRNSDLLDEEEKKALFDFQKICDDYEFLKNL
ncbi:XRE family transcriptional regulator [bacterium]|nr:MAG: XRE family transcriptional regulator [bacterium]